MLDIVKHKTEDIVSMLENIGYYLINEQQKHEYQTYTKPDGSLLTELDLASEMLIKNELNSLFGDIKIISEENNEDENKQIATNERFYFLLDPIDGTSYFNKGKEFTINLAFCIDGKPMLSFIHNPLKKMILFGNNDKAFLRHGGKVKKLMRLKPIDKYDIAVGEMKKPLRLVIGTHMFANKDYTQFLTSAIQQKGYNFSKYTLKASSAMGKLFLLANGDTDGFLTSKVCKDWDILPSLPILNAIGASYHTDNPMVFCSGNFAQGCFIAGRGQELVDDLAEIAKNTETMQF